MLLIHYTSANTNNLCSSPRFRPWQQQAHGRSGSPDADDADSKADARAAEALALARHGIVFRASATALHRALVRAERRCAAGAPPAAARAARIDLAAALITWGRRSRRPARMHRASERLLRAALKADPGDALAQENLAILHANRRLRAAEATARAALAGERFDDEEEDEDDSEEAAEGESEGALVPPPPKYLHVESRDGVHTAQTSESPSWSSDSDPSENAEAEGKEDGRGGLEEEEEEEDVEGPEASTRTGRRLGLGVTDEGDSSDSGATNEGGTDHRGLDRDGGLGSGGGGRRRWLAIGIPTVPRRGDPGYLARTLRAIAQQLPARTDDPLHGQVAALRQKGS